MKITITTMLLALCLPAMAQNTAGTPVAWSTNYTGNDIISPCKQAVVDLDENSSKWEHGENNAYWVGLCKGIVAGTVGGMPVSEVDLQGTNQGQVIRVVENYLQSHPELLNKDAGWLVRQALKKAFPPK